MTKLSVNINKVATLRNARGENNPNVEQVALDCEAFGANGITVHPRPDERHIKYADVLSLKEILRTEFNIEGYPDERFVELVLKVVPTQVTLVPDSPTQLTSNHGWNTVDNEKFLTDVISTFKKAGIDAKRVLKEFRYDDVTKFALGQEIKADMFKEGDLVDVSGTSKGHGFSGVIKRWNHHRLKMTHGVGPVHREVGSMGANSTPSRVFKGKKMPGQYGHEAVTIQNLKVVRVDADRNLILVKGAIPGPKKSIVTIKSAVKA